jgi:hypothetical protein
LNPAAITGNLAPAMRITIKRPLPDDTIDMTLDGEILTPPPPTLLQRVLRGIVAIALVGAVVASTVLALWFALLLVPIVLIAGVIAWAAWRWQLWRMPRRF